MRTENEQPLPDSGPSRLRSSDGIEGGRLPIVVGIPWYRREHYDHILGVMEDGDRLPATYDRWIESALKGIERLSHQGFITVQAEIEPESLVAWCRSRSHDIDSHGRHEWAQAVALETARQRGLLPGEGQTLLHVELGDGGRPQGALHGGSDGKESHG